MARDCQLFASSHITTLYQGFKFLPWLFEECIVDFDIIWATGERFTKLKWRQWSYADMILAKYIDIRDFGS